MTRLQEHLTTNAAAMAKVSSDPEIAGSFVLFSHSFFFVLFCMQPVAVFQSRHWCCSTSLNVGAKVLFFFFLFCMVAELDKKIHALEQEDSSSSSSSDSESSFSDDEDDGHIPSLPATALPEAHGYKGSTQTKKPRREKVGCGGTCEWALLKSSCCVADSILL